MQKQTEFMNFSLRSDGIVEIQCLPNTVMTIEQGKLSTKIVAEITESKPMPMLCDLTNVVKMSHECRQHFAGPEHAAVFSKCALIISSPISKVIGNFFLGANKPLRPTKLFTNKQKGLDWLKSE